jgi:hypothetical protein
MGVAGPKINYLRSSITNSACRSSQALTTANDG